MTTMAGNERPKTNADGAREVWTAVMARVVLPSFLGAALFYVFIFLIILPAMEDSLIDAKSEVSRSLVQAVCAELAAYEEQVQSGSLTRADAQHRACELVRHLRYGDAAKNYLWIMDFHPRMIMHPYRPELDGQDVTEVHDAAGKPLFREFVRTARSGGGDVAYLWQWYDDPHRIEPKLSYVQPFEPWGWIVGTGNYVDDVAAQIQSVSRRLAAAAGVALSIVALLAGYQTWHGYRTEHRRRRAESAVQRLNQELEQRVEARTAELTQATQRLQAEVDERRQAESRQQALQQQLAQAQRLESVGQLAAGIAHEINTPAQFVSDNTRFLRSAFPKLADLLTQYRHLATVCRDGPVADELLDDLEAVVKTTKLDYLLAQIPEALSDSLEGLERVTKIVRAMKDFSHPGQQSMAPADLNKAIESTVTVARNEWKYVAEMQLELDPDLPHVPCMLGDLNQVFLNIIVNAAHAIKDAVGVGVQGKGTITVTTRTDGDAAEIRIRDTGTGIPEEHRHRIFDHFFTTKEVGKGTGQGLALARQLIVEKHHGTLTFETEVGRGTTFIIRLPVHSGETSTTKEPENDLAHSAGG
ncbi:MAG: cache domain-containing protein [Phycisphaerae bacterium]|nr:cache domain-containing protein [Phycisphaerae bacterium]